MAGCILSWSLFVHIYVSLCGCSGLWPDWLHVFDLALLPDAIASGLLELTDTRMPFPDPSRDERLQRA